MKVIKIPCCSNICIMNRYRCLKIQHWQCTRSRVHWELPMGGIRSQHLTTGLNLEICQSRNMYAKEKKPLSRRIWVPQLAWMFMSICFKNKSNICLVNHIIKYWISKISSNLDYLTIKMDLTLKLLKCIMLKNPTLIYKNKFHHNREGHELQWVQWNTTEQERIPTMIPDH